MAMTKGERDDLLRVVRSRSKALKTAAEQRAKELVADFEEQMAAVYNWANDERWTEAVRAAQAAVDEAKAKVADRCKELGIPPQYSPGLQLSWRAGGEQMFKERQAELRRAAKSRIDAVFAEARAKIETLMSDAEIGIYQHGLATDAAKELFSKIPTVEQLMPVIKFEAIAGAREEKRYDYWGKALPPERGTPKLTLVADEET